MKRLLATFLACALACLAQIAPAADGLGRLFFEPGQRALLDDLRARRDRRAPITTEPEQAAPQGPEVVTYSGVVRRNDGKSTVWINGKPVNDRARGGDVNVLDVRRDGAVSVAVPLADRAASLKVGQSLEVTSGRIEEPYARAATLYRPPPMPSAAAAPASAVPAAQPAEPVRPATPATPRRAVQRDEKDADPASGAAPAIRRGVQP